MRVPNAELAFIDASKLRDYALNPVHRVGGHKARLFSTLLGMNNNDADALQQILLNVIQTEEATLGELDGLDGFDDFDELYELDELDALDELDELDALGDFGVLDELGESGELYGCGWFR